MHRTWLFNLNTADACPMQSSFFQQLKLQPMEGAASFVIDGMTCGSCSTKVATHLNGVDGVLASAVDYQTGKVEVAFDSAKIDTKKLETELVSTGYALKKES